MPEPWRTTPGAPRRAAAAEQDDETASCSSTGSPQPHPPAGRPPSRSVPVMVARLNPRGPARPSSERPVARPPAERNPCLLGAEGARQQPERVRFGGAAERSERVQPEAPAAEPDRRPQYLHYSSYEARALGKDAQTPSKDMKDTPSMGWTSSEKWSYDPPPDRGPKDWAPRGGSRPPPKPALVPRPESKLPPNPSAVDGRRPPPSQHAAELRGVIEAFERRVAEQLGSLEERMREGFGGCGEMLRSIARAQEEAAAESEERERGHPALDAAVDALKETVRELRQRSPSPAEHSRVSRRSAGPLRTLATFVRGGLGEHSPRERSPPRKSPRVSPRLSPVDAPQVTVSDADHAFRAVNARMGAVNSEGAEAWEVAEIQDLQDASSEGSGCLEDRIKITRSEEERARYRQRKRRCVDRLRGLVGDREERTIFAILSRSPNFNLLGMFMTVVNCVVIAVDADMNTTDALLDALAVEHPDNSYTKSVLLNVQRAFFFWLLFEVLVHFLGSRIEFFVGEQKWWNFIDVTILVTSIPQVLSGSVNFSFLRFLRLLRGARALQAVRFIRYSYSLQKMVAAFTSTVLTLFWAACMLLIIVYIFGLAMMEGVHSFVSIDAHTQPPTGALGYDAGTPFAGAQDAGLVQDLHSYYGGVGRTFVTLFRAISGADWSEFAAPLFLTGPLWGMVWMIYIFVVVFGCLNIITGMVVDILRQPMPTDRKFRMLVDAKEEKAVFEIFADELRVRGKDVQETLLSKKFFDEFTQRESISKQLRDFGIDIKRWHDAFHLIDFENKGRITAATIARRFLALRDEAKTQEVVRLAKDVVQVKRAFAEIAKLVLEIHDRLPQQHQTTSMSQDVEDIEEIDGQYVTTVKA